MDPFVGRRQWLGLATLGCIACRPTSSIAPNRTPYARWRADNPSTFERPAPGPAAYDDAALNARLEAVTWPGPLGPMRGWIAIPDGPGPFPGLVWLHGAFAASAAQFDPLGDAFPPRDFAVFVPTWRGENGNPGARELLAGELDDAVSAVRWFAARAEVESDAVFALGHSVGGGLSALLALVPDLPLRETASVGGIYVPKTFERWSSSAHNGPLIRFDATDPDEGRLRTLVGNEADLQRPHVAYVGEEDRWFHPNVERVRIVAASVGAPFEVVYVPGDHMGSLGPAYRRHMARLREGGR